MKTAYPQYQGTIQIRLYSNIPFDNSYQHHSLISGLFKYNNSTIYTGTANEGIAKERFLNRKIVNSNNYYYPRYDISGEYNFDYSNGLVCNVVLELTAEQTNANYMRIYSHNDDGGEYYYYFITGIQQVNVDTYRLNLELDVLMTYQDEFLEGMKDIPVFTTRKHCTRYTNNGLYLRCEDYKTGDSIFANIKPSIIKSKQDLHFNTEYYSKLETIKWLYICCDAKVGGIDFKAWRYKFKNVEHPLLMLCVPINLTSLTITDGNESYTITDSDIQDLISYLVSDGTIKGCKISSYPPFGIGDDYTITGSGRTLTINIAHIEQDTYGDYWENGKMKLIFKMSQFLSQKFFLIMDEINGDVQFGGVSFTDFVNTDAPTTTSNRYSDPKLLFNPFRKYMLASTYSSGNEFFPELIYSNGLYKSNEFGFGGIYTSYIGDYNIFTYQKEITDINFKKHYRYYKENNIGLSAMVNYNLPTGTNALDVFNSTQAQSFYTSKVASGVSSGLAIVGGIASIVVGAGMTVGSSGALTPAGSMMVTGGITSIAGGVAGVGTTLKSVSAKQEDLANTPDAINVQGSSFVSDYARTDMLPFIITYECSDVVKHQADDYFYHFGYEVGRDCYFNIELKYDNDSASANDNILFVRSIFNYIQIKDDITNKINANMPLIIKKKISDIFNNGITLWSMFSNKSLWGTASTLSTNYPDRWFMKSKLDNTEYSLL